MEKKFAQRMLPKWLGSGVFREKTLYFCCTTVADVGKRIKQLEMRRPESAMFRPSAVCPLSQDNADDEKLQQSFADGYNRSFDKRSKMFNSRRPCTRRSPSSRRSS
ncbi:hypothetical protein F442_15171 [Phytophthora nicotianae P10297]|uniref:Uncharacterized protein n=3 Tax=Phytophthora nicotianae TaxID=4792 RepID=V9EIJ3_PHYNI|nr:hypothetical protein F443_15326 [Phytophthora nicotianae P1569]ETO67777.1 hypothetical protein F444_15331 [Phytophthora nicotianae P1976]ETP36986.1 hypothetical protein F442_15171 [Phytophthora nicotianae P10297]